MAHAFLREYNYKKAAVGPTSGPKRRLSDLLELLLHLIDDDVAPRVTSDCHSAAQPNHFTPGFRSYSAAVFSNAAVGCIPGSHRAGSRSCASSCATSSGRELWVRARVIVDQFRHFALQTGQGHRVSTYILANLRVSRARKVSESRSRFIRLVICPVRNQPTNQPSASANQPNAWYHCHGCPRRTPPFLAVKRLARPCKRAMQTRFTVGNAKAAPPGGRGPTAGSPAAGREPAARTAPASGCL